MRCPKCGYISFDLIEKCVKCGKNINAASKQLQGTVGNVPPPAFLSPDYTEREAEREEQQVEHAGEQAFDLGGEEEVFVDFTAGDEPAGEEEPTVEEPGPEEAVIDLADLAPVEAAEAGAEITMEDREVGREELAFAVGDEKPSTAASPGQGLEDLKVEGIDLDASPAGRDEITSPVKTGTALDSFDVDLEEVFGKK
ncbi:MAG: hypothetical protein RBR09_13210 [Desulfobulbaceae bacterium]|jgi:hypothetical protein|nr:hypothetical protein [Desulfobulbaceae bacterium]MDY0352209.1 hypothetical protein [Desulfobulbaceae bacterium]